MLSVQAMPSAAATMTAPGDTQSLTGAAGVRPVSDKRSLTLAGSARRATPTPKCPMCYELVTEAPYETSSENDEFHIAVLPCGHQAHWSCTWEHVSRNGGVHRGQSCPFCRHNFKYHQLGTRLPWEYCTHHGSIEPSSASSTHSDAEPSSGIYPSPQYESKLKVRGYSTSVKEQRERMRRASFVAQMAVRRWVSQCSATLLLAEEADIRERLRRVLASTRFTSTAT